MAKTTGAPKPAYRCTECGWQTAKWAGRCGECQAWGTVDITGGPRLRQVVAGPVTAAAVPIGEVDVAAATARPTGVAELDRVLGGGLVPGAVVLLAGEPGVGKSTLLLEVAAQIAPAAVGARLYVTGEESAAQVRLRAGRIGALDDDLYLAAETDLAAVLAHVDAVQPELLVVDSVQTIATPESTVQAGGVTQVREVAAALIRIAKERSIATVLVGHVTKDGSIAGPRVLEHLVDVVLPFEGDRHSRLRLVRAVKNRYGPADEVGCFDLNDDGIVGLRRPLRAVPLARARTRCPAPASPWRWRAGARWSRRCRRWSHAARAQPAPRDLRPRRRRGSPWCSPSSSAAAGSPSGSPPATSTPRRSAASGSSSRPPTSRSRSRWRRAALDQPLPVGLVAIGEVGLAGEVRRVPGIGPEAGRGRPARLHARRSCRPSGPPPDRLPRHRGRRPARPRVRALSATADRPAPDRLMLSRHRPFAPQASGRP